MSALHKRILSLFIILAGTIFMTACSRLAPINNIQNQPVPNGLTQSEVKDSILAAGKYREFSMSPVSDGVIDGTYTSGKHMIKVEIDYSTNSYSIHYKSSYNMLAEGDMIHYNYNRWVNNLNADIQRELSKAAFKKS